jgi:biofilm protein TabA
VFTTILGDFLNWEEDKRALSPVLVEALEIIRSKSFEDVEEGVYPIDKDGTRLIVKEVLTTPFEELPPEKHELFIDIHYIITGAEKYGFARESKNNIPKNVIPAIEDHTFFVSAEQEAELTMYPGQFIIFLPTDVHRPWCKAAESPTVRKALLKFPVKNL